MFDREKFFEARYSAMLKRDDGRNDISNFTAVMQGVSYWDEYSLSYCMKLQNDLYEKGLIPFVLTSVTMKDWKKIHELDADIRDFYVKTWWILERPLREKRIKELEALLSNADT